MGGLVVVYVAARALLAEGRCRATLLALWAMVHVVLVLGYLQASRIGAASLVLAVALAPVCALGGALGAWAHGRLAPARRAVLVHSAVVAAGVAVAAL